ncbi:hypothetical protein [Plantactinospora endophytica]|uniref:Uncharacterized protein n=1 Tax=Plantactinospora endophytica TaxID=673535 RepID=A0ABQ4E587_9ACTN|nr:hypothetical protein [Plantactinospora endophytica]GIG89878.1 hypothetical protein Pen02_48140 [Plantactinospora endophytica]
MSIRRSGHGTAFGGWAMLHSPGTVRRLVAELPAAGESRIDAGRPDKYGDRYVAVDGSLA